MNVFSKISIVTPSFNQGRFLEKTILSVLEQGYPNLEYIIIDGGSTDGSLEIIKNYERHLTYWVSEPDRGQSDAINKGFGRATGEILGWLNSDDRYTPGALQAIAGAFREHPEAGAVVGAGEMADEDGNSFWRVARTSVSLESLFNWSEEFFWQPSCFFRREVWNDCGPLDVNIHFAMDLDYWIKTIKKYRFVTIDQLISISLKHKEAKTTKLYNLSIIDAFLIIFRHGGDAQARKGLERYTEEMVSRIAVCEKRIQALNARINRLSNENIRKGKDINYIYNSISWKITKPFRIIIDKFIKLKHT